MNLASHNSFSYLPPLKWYMRPLRFTARCQREGYFWQYSRGVRLFDLRVRFDENGVPVICHGLMEYKHDSWLIDAALSVLDGFGGCYVRVVLELKKRDTKQEIAFINFCNEIVKRFRNVTFFGGNNRSDWSCQHPIYHFKNGLEDIDHKYSSTTTLFPKGWKWLGFIDDLCPRLYATRHNRENIENGTTHKWLMIDFVDIR